MTKGKLDVLTGSQQHLGAMVPANVCEERFSYPSAGDPKRPGIVYPTGVIRARAIAASPKPRIIKLHVHREEPATFAAGDKKLRALHFTVHTKITGVAGVVAPLVGNQSPDSKVWILDGAVPLFLKFEGPLDGGGPIWQIEPVGVVDPGESDKRHQITPQQLTRRP